MVYTGHQAYLIEDHALREGFLGCKPPHMTAFEWKELKLMYHEGLPNGMKRFSILFELPYWINLQINHLLDPMHILNNVETLLWDHIIGKKDSLNTQEAL